MFRFRTNAFAARFGFFSLVAMTSSVAAGTPNRTENAQWLANDRVVGEQFGVSVASKGTSAVVGAWRDTENDLQVGSAYLIDIPTGAPLFKWAPTNTNQWSYFGSAVALDDSVALVGAWGTDVVGPGLGGGAAYLYDLATGTQLHRLLPTEQEQFDDFGVAVALDGGKVLVSNPADDDNGLGSGSVSVFDVATGTEVAQLRASNAAPQEFFGVALAAQGGKAIISARTNVNGQTDAGSAYLFDITTGQQLFQWTASDAAAFDSFGFSVAIDGRYAVIGAYAHDDGSQDAGAAYVFDTFTGAELFKLTASDPSSFAYFGWSVAVEGNFAIIGARGDDVAALNSGSAYVFDVTTGTELLKLAASDAARDDAFGWSVALADRIALVGAPWNYAPRPLNGSAYVFEGIPEASSLILVGIVGTLASLRIALRSQRRSQSS
ncbi:FG-GAP repeat protein [bacterium]|nr:FG-GAP repeat protein [bacterium]